MKQRQADNIGTAQPTWTAQSPATGILLHPPALMSTLNPSLQVGMHHPDEEQTVSAMRVCTSLPQVIGRTHSPALLCLQAFTEDSRTALRSTQHPHEDKTVLACGCYSTGPRTLGAAGDQARFEHCLMVDDGERVRVVQELKQDGGTWKATTVEVSCLLAVQVGAGHIKEGEWASALEGPECHWPLASGIMALHAC